MSTDLEQLLRRTLDNRAATVTSGPRWQQPPSGHRRRLAALGAAAAVAAVAIAIAVIPGGPSTQSPAQSHPPTSVVTTLPPAPQLHGASCAATLPSAWQQAIAAGVLPASAGRLVPLAISPAGAVLARRSSGEHDQLVLVRPDRSTSVIYTAATLRISAAAANSRWVMVTRTQSGGAPYAIDAVDRTTGSVIQVRSASTRPDAIVQPPVLFGNAIYWTEGDQFGVGDVRAFDLAHRTTRLLDHGYLSRPVSLGGGLFWLKSQGSATKSGRLITHVPGTLPPGFAVQPWSAYADLAQDGQVFAWGNYDGSDPKYAYHVWTPGAPAIAVFPPGQSGDGEVPVLAMPYLFARGRVVDLRSGANAPMPDAVQFAAGDVLAVEVGQRLSIVQTAQLPQPRC